MKYYPNIALKKAVIFPGEKVPLVLEGVDVVETTEKALSNDRLIVLSFQKNGEESEIGVMAKILQYWYLTPQIMGLSVEGLSRVKILKSFSEGNARNVEIAEIVGEKETDMLEIEALSRSVFEQFKKLIQLEGSIPIMIADELRKDVLSAEEISNVVLSGLKLSFKEKIEMLETLDLKKRLEIINRRLAKELVVVGTEKKIQRNIAKEMGKAQKEMILREQMRAIEKELGISGEQGGHSELEKKIKRAALPPFVREKAEKEFYRLKTMASVSAEAPFIRTYLDWILDLPWMKKSETKINLDKAKEVLDEDHYGLQKAKERVLEFLAVQKLVGSEGKGNILCFAGPPGTGKTSVGKSIAKALGRSFVRISLGGVRDEAEIRGHRRTYIGALPGRIIQAMKTAGTRNPVFMLDEIDKLGADFLGNPAAALLEVLDPEQNNSFSDHYIELPFDLSEVFFITTANILDPIPPALRDRMETIEFPGYTDEEKFQIAKKYLLPRVLSDHGLSEKQLTIEDGALMKIINKHTREAGVREFERKLKEIARKTARKIAENEAMKQNVGESNLSEYIGPEEYEITMREAEDEVGVSTGLAWTPVGGEIIFIEAAFIPGKGKITLTGQLGEVMQESAKAAISYLRSKSRELKINPGYYYKSDVHVHVPSGAIPKDGPSAGIAIATALASALTKKKVRKEIALTGEITLSGKVLKIGGVKEKVLAAHRAGVEVVIMPKDNEKNLIDVPESIKKKLKFKFVGHMDDVLKIALKNK